MSMSSPPAAKRAKTGDNGNDGDDQLMPSIGLLHLYQSDLGKKILSFASASDLCILDAVNKQFQRLTIEPWKDRTRARFGSMKNNAGKDGWKIGTSYLRPPVFIAPIDETDHGLLGLGDRYPGRARAAANEFIVVAVADEVDPATGIAIPSECNPMCMGMRDAYTLNYIRTEPSPVPNCNVAICGQVGSEIIVTSNLYQICARRGKNVQGWQCRPQMLNGVPIIGCKTHLIVALGNDVEVYRVTSTDVATQGVLVSLRNKFTVESSNGGVENEHISAISWGSDKSHLIVCFSHQISVWKFDPSSDTISLTQTIVTTSTDKSITNVALAEDYIIGSSEDKKLHIWNRSTGEKMHDALCDIEDEEDMINQEEMDHPLCLHCSAGNILVSTSQLGCALCVWDMKTGELLSRHIDAFRGHINQLPDGYDATDMAYLERLNAFLCMSTGNMYVWSFPTNKKQSDMATSIRSREMMALRALYEE